ncbi:hypothetical protein BU23DRAFT_553611 [Bimuria novae-zelandiae CBS 107.79]|uniref:PPP4R2-domain-containing protein n=1 Tax=Bimuria novae-zelandiae CBS 107.79 TaxID=1447943 RepID=A0A6A5VE56_9PLEO|nr:hypothetical protein BU23DRAFT_553611 [Bimuria novae-zelandiae CBS 107.79]
MATPAEKLLQKAAEDGSLDAADWPDTRKYILDRLDEIITEFPRPPQNTDSSPAPNTPTRQQTQGSSQDSQSGDKENAAPRTPSRPPVPTFSNSESQDLPQETLNFYSSIRNALSNNFPKGAPHTIQRLAELILEPKRKYKFLPAYLRALDRVVSVSSPNTIFPLPLAVLPTATGLLNGTTHTNAAQATLGSDESLGGALLTPIPWLQNRGQNELISESTEMVDGPNGAGRIETVTVGMLNGSNGNGAQATSPTSSDGVSQIASSHPDGETLPSTGPVTQGEILRQEQEAGVVLNNPHSLTSQPARTTVGETEAGAAVVDTVEGEEEQPHARGPEMIGMEDTGPQHAASGQLDIEGAVGRPSMERHSRSPQPPGEKDEEMGGTKEDGEKETRDGDGDEDMKTDG